MNRFHIFEKRGKNILDRDRYKTEREREREREITSKIWKNISAIHSKTASDFQLPTLKIFWMKLVKVFIIKIFFLYPKCLKCDFTLKWIKRAMTIDEIKCDLNNQFWFHKFRINGNEETLRLEGQMHKNRSKPRTSIQY